LEKVSVLMTLIAMACVPFASRAFAQSDHGHPQHRVRWTECLSPGTNVTMPPALPSTVGTLAAEHPGFTSYPQATIRVQVAVARRLDVTLQMAIDAGGPGNRRILMRKTESGEPPATTAADTEAIKDVIA
jgi:hypothetical protein